MEVNGKIIVIGETETIGAKDFKKRLLVVQTDEQYPQSIPVEFTQDKTNLLDKFKVNDLVKVSINLRGSEWKGKYYANIQGWRIDKVDLLEIDNMPNRQKPYTGEPINNALPQEEELNDLPF
jgi:CobQ-like glutamine amidotransferase family enzyme